MATISKIEIETRRLQSDIESLRSHLQRMSQISNRMMAGVNALSSMWEGEAKNAFVMQFETDYKTLKSLEDVIKELIKNLEFAKEKYDSCENKVASIIESIKV